ncbi:hypothetical protein [Micromonospora foliorum]|uniref:hypothetical protein n=1 Tax=Micromonospora foliorum TaxID=2911210 RepID=UPI001EE92FC2|nr:hypothetical protein [Micromonospora foliorum]MCG5434923.1 hypothetical protein [Micromonospora foliorum]
MRWLQLHLRSRRVPLATATGTALIALAWALSLAYTDSPTINARTASLAIMLAVVAVGTTLTGADDALDHTMAVNWPLRRGGHLLLASAAITALLSLSMITDTRYEPFALVLRNTAGLLGLTALGATLLGAALAWIAPLTWTLIAVLPMMGPSRDLKMQVAGWPIQPVGTTAATACAAILAVTGLLAYALRGCPVRPVSETAPDR